MLSFFSPDVLGEIWDVIESVSEGFLTYSIIGSEARPTGVLLKSEVFKVMLTSVYIIY